MTAPPVGIYARVSSEQQAGAQTVASQLAALRERVAADGVALPDELTFVDDGVSGATLVRPALERLRDLAAAGGFDRLYVHSPDRLARKYAYQVLLLDELARVGVAVVFLNRALGSTPEDELLLQAQGMVAEYERAKILERARRGKLHAARSGAVSVLGHAPYGYRYVRKADGGGQARYEVLLEEARVVRQVFAWVRAFATLYEEAARRFRTAVGSAWSVDETYVKGAGAWVYVYRAIDERGQVVDVYVSTKRAAGDAATFFQRAIEATGVAPETVTTDCAAYPPALTTVLPPVAHETGKAVQQRIERDHQHLQGRLRPLRGFKTLVGARVLCAGHAVLRNLRGGFYDFGWTGDGSASLPKPPVLDAWDTLSTELLAR